jgi:signal transduction histidine kinase
MQRLLHSKTPLAGPAVPLASSVAEALSQARARQHESECRLSRIAHELRNRLGAITAAVEVLNFAEAGGELAAEAKEVISRQTRLLAQMLQDIGATPRNGSIDSLAAEQIVVDTARWWLQSPGDDMLPSAGGDGHRRSSGSN